MKNRKKLLVIALVSVTIILLTGCYKDKTVLLNTGTEVTKIVSLSKDITPIFNTNCSIRGCHNSGGIKPVLTSDRVYNSLINDNYIDLNTPEKSDLYLWLIGKESVPMPVGAANNPSNINQLVLALIKQGAKNN